MVEAFAGSGPAQDLMNATWVLPGALNPGAHPDDFFDRAAARFLRRSDSNTRSFARSLKLRSIPIGAD